MVRGAFWGALTALALAIAAPAWAAHTSDIRIRAGPLSSALQDLARQTGVEFLYDRSVVRSARSPLVRGRMTAEAALQRLLSGTGLTMRRSASGAWLIERQRAVALPPEPELEAPEILVIGRRTQNADIRRREDDVQPYQITTGEEIVRAHRDTIDQYFATRVTANTQIVPVSLIGDGQTRSEIDLRGLGPEGTLVLVDGRRMPTIPEGDLNFLQPDINAVPLHAIERIETLTGTAGGVYGFGALGGVVNVIMRRDYRGAEFHVSGGISTRADAGRLSIEGRIGFTPDGGRTDVMLYFGRTRGDPLLIGQRDYLLRDLAETARLAPDLFLLNNPAFNAVTVYSLPQGENLVFKPEYGGGTLGSDHSFLPTGFSGSPADLVASLTAHAGQLELRPVSGTNNSGLGSNGRTEALIANVRHRFGANVEAYVDALVLRNRGRTVAHDSDGFQILQPDTPTNPFDNAVFITFPVPDQTLTLDARFESERYTAGVVAGLPLGWRGTAEATFGELRATGFRRLENYADSVDDDSLFNPFGDWDRLQASIAANLQDAFFGVRARNHYDEQSVRLAGPVFRTAAGPATLTLLAERRRESIPITRNSEFIEALGPDTDQFETASRALTTRSFYAELRSSIFGDNAPFPLLRSLEVQLAVRHDDQRFDFSRDPSTLDPGQRVRARFTGTAFTAGAKISPFPWLTLRGSYATGEQPPPLEQLIDSESQSSFVLALDPKRGGTYPGLSDFQFLIHKEGGSPDLRTARATTFSVGAFSEPFGGEGLRLSLDYSRIHRTRDVYTPSDQTILDHEDFWPERIVRAPLTDADRALGYTAGRITTFDSRAMNGAGRVVETIDARFDWPLRFLGGRLRLYGNATWQLHNIEHRLFEPDLEHAGWNGGPLSWRANGGADWTIGAMTFGANVQYFSRYRVLVPGQPFINDLVTQLQGSERVPSQTYVDLYASRRLSIGGAGSPYELSVDLGIVNLLDTAPPRESGSIGGGTYSRYGDPRRRRIELVLSSSF